MRSARRFLLRMRGAFRSYAIETEIDEEFTSHLHLQIEDSIRTGMDLEQARKEALLRLGSLEEARQAYHQEAALRMVEHRVQDCQHAVTDLRKTPTYTALLVILLALGMGAVTSTLSVLFNEVLAPFPYKHSSHMLHLLAQTPDGHSDWPLYSGKEFEAIRHSGVAEDAFGYRNRELRLRTDHGPQPVKSTDLTAGAFHYLGVPLLMGRELSQADLNVRPIPVVLGYALWRSQFGGNRHVLGKTIWLDGQDHTIVGVARQGFTWGDGDLFVPAGNPDASDLPLEINLRLRPDVTPAAAEGTLNGELQAFARQEPGKFPPHFRAHLMPLSAPFTLQARSTVPVLLLGAALLFLGVCGASCLLATARIAARSGERDKKLVRSSAYRVPGYLVAEFLLLSLVGSSLGLLLASVSIPVITAALPPSSVPSEAVARLGPCGWIVAASLVLTSVFILGVTAAIASRQEAAVPRLASAGPVHRLHRSILAGQVASTIFLLAAGCLAAEAYLHVTHVALGYQPAHVEVFGLPISEATHRAPSARAAYLEQLVSLIRSTPEVQDAAMSFYATPPNSSWPTLVTVTHKEKSAKQRVSAHFVSADFFKVLQVPLIRGTIWSAAEEINAVPVAVINQAMQREIFGDANPVGRHLQLPSWSYMQYSMSALSGPRLVKVVGVVADFHNDDLRSSIAPSVYLPFSDFMGRGTQVLVRSQIAQSLLAAALYSRISAFNPGQEIYAQPDLASLIKRDPAMARARLLGVFFGFCSLVALLSAAVSFMRAIRFIVPPPNTGVDQCRSGARLELATFGFKATIPFCALGVAAGAAFLAALRKVLERALLTSDSIFTPELVSLAVVALVVLIVSASVWRHVSRAPEHVSLRSASDYGGE